MQDDSSMGRHPVLLCPLAVFLTGILGNCLLLAAGDSIQETDRREESRI